MRNAIVNTGLHQQISFFNKAKTRNSSGDEIAKRDLMIFGLLIYSPAL